MSTRKQLVFISAAIAAVTILILSTTSQAGDRSDLKEAIIDGRAKNVILMIGDGMGDSEITIARNYWVGAAGHLALDTLPLTGEYTTYSVREDNPKLPDYVTDSAASATAWATGTKTSNGRISTTANSDRDLKTILELAREKGYLTGNISTAELTDATPAALMSKVANRSCQGPEDLDKCPQDKKSAGGSGSIAEQSIERGIDVLLGGGKQRYEQAIDSGQFAGKTVTEAAKANGYQVVTDASGLKSTQPGTKLLGLFNSDNMSLEWNGDPAVPFPGSAPQRCRENSRPINEPSLAEMTSKAIELLDRNKGINQKVGFFLQVEGASIDKRDHAANPCEQIGETVAFDRAVKVALDYAKSNPDTLIIVTADHGHTSQIIPNPTETEYSPGVYSTLITADKVPMTINYATNLPGHSQEHTGTQVRIAAKGPQAFRVVGIINQTDLFHIIARAIGAE